jgi:4-hydroxybenzoate polyprenyltransferase
MAGAPLKSFRDSPWRYAQFAVLGLAAAGLAKWLTPLAWPMALAAGAAVGAAYLLFEKRRGVI